jgi:predicted  nucleic acid-binding Zn-ribbon protein
MTRVTATLSDAQADFLEEIQEQEGIDSDAAAMREAVDRARERDDLLEEVESLRARTRELEQELMSTNRRIDATNELVEWAEEERSLAERREERQSAPVWRRAKWWVFGRE